MIDTGPLRIRDQFFPGMGFLAFDPDTDEGGISLVDGEFYRTSLAVQRGS
jgi:hypothetical protein